MYYKKLTSICCRGQYCHDLYIFTHAFELKPRDSNTLLQTNCETYQDNHFPTVLKCEAGLHSSVLIKTEMLYRQMSVNSNHVANSKQIPGVVLQLLKSAR